MEREFLIEAVVDSVEAALAAEAAGADRLELCSGLELGGLTPGAGLLRQVCAVASVPVHVLLRPRGGDFMYSKGEFETLMHEIDACKEAGAAGIVVGILLPNGQIDVARMQAFVEAADSLPVTFHRAFDRVADRRAAVEELLQTGCNRVLTSGFCGAAADGTSSLRWLREVLGERVVVMPGGGVNAGNASQIALATGASEYHLSAIQLVPSHMAYFPEWMPGDRPGTWMPAPEKVAALKAELIRHFESKA